MRCRPLLTILTLVIVVAPWGLAQSGVRIGNQTQSKQKQKVAKAQVKTRRTTKTPMPTASISSTPAKIGLCQSSQEVSEVKAMVLRLVAQYRMSLWLLRMREF